MEWPGSYDRPCFTHCDRAVVCERAFVGHCTQFHELLSHRAADMMMMTTTRGGGGRKEIFLLYTVCLNRLTNHWNC